MSPFPFLSPSPPMPPYFHTPTSLPLFLLKSTVSFFIIIVDIHMHKYVNTCKYECVQYDMCMYDLRTEHFVLDN